jgi:hypothetical protein
VAYVTDEQVDMLVGLGFVEEGFELPDIDIDVGFRIELDRLAIGQNQRNLILR